MDREDNRSIVRHRPRSFEDRTQTLPPYAHFGALTPSVVDQTTLLTDSCPTFASDPFSSPDCTPDAQFNDHLRSNDDFIRYLISLPQPPPCPKKTNRNSMPKVGLDHLDNLCRLMEQLGDLKEQNAKLQKRVQYLEDMKQLNDMHRQMIYALALKELKNEQKDDSSEKSTLKRHTIAEDELSRSKTQSAIADTKQSVNRERSRSVHTMRGLAAETQGRKKHIKWSKMREAFGLESGTKNSDQSRAHSVRILRDDIISQLQIPVFTEDLDDSDKDTEQRPPFMKRTGHYSDDNGDSEHAFDRDSDSRKSRSRAWERVKTIIQVRRDSLKKRRKPSTQLITAAASCPTSLNDKVICPPHKEDLTIPKRKQKTRPTPLQLEPPSVNIKDDSSFGGASRSSSGVRSDHKSVSGETSPQAQRKSRWTKMKKVFASGSTKRDSTDADNNFRHSKSVPSSPASATADAEFDYITCDQGDNMMEESPNCDETNGFSQSFSSVRSPVIDLMTELQRNLSDDFTQKMRDWERMKSSGFGKPPTPRTPESKSKIPIKLKSGERLTRSSKQKHVSWLNKELQKVERDKLRLSKELQKNEDRYARLERLRNTLVNKPYEHEILVKTSAGEFRFEGITDSFTKKLYEWETKRGVAPDMSTIALLATSTQSKTSPDLTTIHYEDDTVGVPNSRSETSIAVQESTHRVSLPLLKPTDVNSALLVENRSADQSKANSEPDLSALNSRESTLRKNNLFARETKPSTSDENYYSLLEENMYLLEQLKNKEEICRRLEEELESMDDKMVDIRTKHLSEMDAMQRQLTELSLFGASAKDHEKSMNAVLALTTRIKLLEQRSEQLRGDYDRVAEGLKVYQKVSEERYLEMMSPESQDYLVPKSGSAQDRFVQIHIRTWEHVQGLCLRVIQLAYDVEDAYRSLLSRAHRLRWELFRRDLGATERAHDSAMAMATRPGSGLRKRQPAHRTISDTLLLRRHVLLQQILPTEPLPDQYNDNGEVLLHTLEYIQRPLELAQTARRLQMELRHPIINSPDTSVISAAVSAAEVKDAEISMISSTFSEDQKESRRCSSSISGQEHSDSSSCHESETSRKLTALPPKTWSRGNISSSSDSSSEDENETFSRPTWCQQSASPCRDDEDGPEDAFHEFELQFHAAKAGIPLSVTPINRDPEHPKQFRLPETEVKQIVRVAQEPTQPDIVEVESSKSAPTTSSRLRFPSTERRASEITCVWTQKPVKVVSPRKPAETRVNVQGLIQRYNGKSPPQSQSSERTTARNRNPSPARPRTSALFARFK